MEAVNNGFVTATQSATSESQCGDGETFFWCQQPGSSTDNYDYCGNNGYCPVNDVNGAPCCYCGGCLVSDDVCSEQTEIFEMGSASQMSADACFSTCEGQGKIVAVPQSESETSTISALIPSQYRVWVGIKKVGGVWTRNGEPYTGWTDWHGSGEGNTGEVRAAMVFNNSGWNGDWYDMNNDGRAHWCVCENTQTCNDADSDGICDDDDDDDDNDGVLDEMDPNDTIANTIPNSFDSEVGTANLNDNVKLWLDGSRTYGLINGEASNPATSGNIAYWHDLSGQGKHGTIGSDPQYTNDGIYFDNNDYAGTPNIGSITNYSVFVVMKPDGTPTETWEGIVGRGGRNFNMWLNNNRRIHHRYTTSSSGNTNNGPGDTPSGSISTSEFNIVNIDHNGSTIRTLINGDVLASTNGNPQASVEGTTFIARNLDSGNNNYFKGWISEIIILNESPSASNLLKINNYLSQKWGLSYTADSDGDGVEAPEDSDDNNPNICSDNDADGCDDCSNGSYNPSNDGTDNDSDGICNVGDTDDDNDGVLDEDDPHPMSSDNSEASIDSEAGTTELDEHLKLWLDATRLYGLDENNSAVNPNDGEEVYFWMDLSGNNNHLSQESASAKPSYNIDNSFKSVQFDGSNDYLEISYNEELNPQDVTIIVVNQEVDQDEYGALISSRDGSPVSGYIMYFNGDDNKHRFWTGDGGNGSSAWHIITSPNPYNQAKNIVFAQATSSDKKLFLNGVLESDDAGGYEVNSQYNLRIGSGRNESGPNYFYDGHISEVFIFNKILSDEERISVHSYLSQKWGMSDVVDSDNDGSLDIQIAI